MFIRSRWVARDFKEKGRKDREDLFSATPPLELMRYMLSRQATIRDDGQERKTLDVKKAHLIPKCDQDVYVQLPPEACAQPDECGKLLFWRYGCRPAAQAWKEHGSAVLSKAGFKRSVSCLVAFVHNSRDLMGVVHGDHFVFVGLDVDLDYILEVLQANYELKNRGRLGRGDKDAKVIDMLGRKLRWYDWGLTWQASSRHKTLLMEYFGMKDNVKVLRIEEQVLDKDEMKAFRMLAARLNCIAQDDPTVQFAAKELCRKMSSATNQDFSKLKKLVLFLVGVEEVLWEYPWQNEREATAIKIQVDSDWAGCERTRRSTSGGCITVGQQPLRTWSSTQSVVATSSAEAELYGTSEDASRGLGLQSMMLELGIEVKLFLMTDSAAAKSFSSTRGLGRMRHVEVKDLWLQELVQKGRLHMLKINGLVNVADAMTKYHDRVTCRNMLARAGLRVVPVMAVHSRSEGGVERWSHNVAPGGA